MQLNFKFIFSAIIGSILEFYDFMLYGIFAGVIAMQFFPKSDAKTNLISSLAVLAVGYFTRPLGGLLFGHFGDKYSRRHTLMFSLIAMGVITTAIGLLPSYQSLGILAPIILVVLRMLQGLTVGGEMPGAMVYLLETANPRYRAVTSTLSLAGAMTGILLAVFVANIVTNYFSQTDVQNYAWRLPFVLGLLLAIVGTYLRARLWQDNITEKVRLPIITLFREHWQQLVIAFMFLIMTALYTGIVSIYFVPYVTHYFNYSLEKATELNLVLTVVSIVTLIFGAWLADYAHCYRRWLLLGTVIMAIVSYPLFVYMSRYPAFMPVGFAIFIFISCVVFGAEIVFLAELFDKKVRYSGIGLAHGGAFSLIGGTSPLLLNYGVIHFGRAAPGLFFAMTAVLAFIAVWLGKTNTISN